MWMVGLGGLEPPTSRLSGVRSNQLSYKPFVEACAPNTEVEFNVLRKEVIQPHLPIRLPCYDFTPIIGPTFDGCLHKWLAHRLRVLQTLVV